MEGLLYKWMGYFAGWNENYFLLRDNQLSEFKSQDHRNNEQPACDSLNIGLCDIFITDEYQWELRGANSKTWFLKAQSTDEKHKWIKAIGSSKACLLGTSLVSHLPANKVHSISTQESVESLEKISHPPSLTISNEDSDSIQEIPNENQELIQHCEVAVAAIDQLRNSLIHYSSESNKKADLCTVQRSLKELLKLMDIAHSATDSQENISDELTESSTEQSSSDASTYHRSDTSVEETSVGSELTLSTFFTTCPSTYGDVQAQMKDGLIPVEIFLEACQSFAQLLDRLASTLLSPLRTDVLSNAEKIRIARKKISPEPEYLQNIVQVEVKGNRYTGSDTGTQALLWLHRSLIVMSTFFFNVFQEDSSSHKINSTSFLRAYEKYLAQHHNWMTQKLFKMGVKMLPDYQTFLRNLLNEDSLLEAQRNNSDWETIVGEKVVGQGLVYAEELQAVALVLRNFFISLDIKP